MTPRNKRKPRGARAATPKGAGPVLARAGGKFQQIEIRVPPAAPPRWPPLSVCLIVKNESANLRPCLESLGDLPSESIVVDTGSTDGTAEIARSMGARVYPFPWIDDFAAARNESLRHATGEWILWLDADDRLTPRAVAQLKRALTSGKADAYMCLVRSRKSNGTIDTVEQIRIFRNGLGIRFARAIHETIAPEMVRLGLTLAHTDILLDHVGYESPEAVRRKHARNLAIIDRLLASNPGDAEMIFYRGHARRGIGDLEGAEADMRRFLAITRPGIRFDWSRFWAYSALISILEAGSDWSGMELLLRNALSEYPEHPYLLFMQARTDLAAGQAERAVRRLRTARSAIQGMGQGLRPPEAWLELGLAEAHRMLGHREEAISSARRASAHSPNWERARTLLACLYIESGRLSEAEELLPGILDAARSDPASAREGHRRKGGEAAQAMPDEARDLQPFGERPDDAHARVKAALLLAATGTRAAHSQSPDQKKLEGLTLLAQGRHLEAAERFAEAIDATPADPDNYKYLAVALHGMGREDEALEAWQIAGRLAIPQQPRAADPGAAIAVKQP